MSIFHFPTEFVYWDTVEKHEEIKKKLLPIILQENAKTKNNPFDTCRFNTSMYTNQEKNAIKNNFLLRDKKLLDSIVFKNIDNMLNKFSLTRNQNNEFCVISGWWNVYNENEHQEEHSHLAPPIPINKKLFYPSLSVIYILHDENEKSSVIFRKDGPIPLIEPHRDCIFKTEEKKEIKEGTILIFPSNLRHLVKPCIKPGRITIAYNIYSAFE